MELPFPKPAHYIRKGPKFLKELYRAKQRLKNTLHRHRAHMRSGWYRLEHSVAMPLCPSNFNPFETTKTSRLSPDIYPIAAPLTNVMDSLFPPCITRIHDHPATETRTGTHLLLSSYSGTVRTFHPSTKQVILHFTNETDFNHLRESISTLAKGLPVISTKFHESSLRALQPLLLAPPLGATANLRQEKIYQQLIVAFSNLVSSQTPRFLTERQITSYFDSLQHIPLPRDLQIQFEKRRTQISNLLLESPVVSTHGDLNADNILVTSGGPCLIDFETFDTLPYFYDPLWLPISLAAESKPALLDELATGESQEIWRPLADAVGTNHAANPTIFLAFFLIFLTDGPLRHEKKKQALSGIRRLWQPVKLRWFNQ